VTLDYSVVKTAAKRLAGW